MSPYAFCMRAHFFIYSTCTFLTTPDRIDLSDFAREGLMTRVSKRV